MPRTPPPSAPARPGNDKPARRPYEAPALEKGLDVLELLACISHGVTQSEIAQLLGRSVQEVYRVVMVLERRGFIQRRIGEDGYFLSYRMHELANRHPPLARLHDIALPAMKAAAVAADQALHVAVLDNHDIRVVVQVDSPAPLGFRLRVGTRNSAAATSSGRLLIAFQRPEVQGWHFDQFRQSRPAGEAEDLIRRIETIRGSGYEMITGEGLQSITDVSFPLLDASGFALAALTMPFLPATVQGVGFDEACRATCRAADTISRMLGGTLPDYRFPLARIVNRQIPTRDG